MFYRHCFSYLFYSTPLGGFRKIDGLKLNVTNQLLVYADVNILGGSVHIKKKNTKSLVVPSKEIGC